MPSPFVTEWVMVRIARFNRIDYRVWSCWHREGYVAYNVTHDDIPPSGIGHYTYCPKWARGDDCDD